MPSVYSFHAAAGSAHDPFGNNGIHGPDDKLVQQGEQTRVGVCKSCMCVYLCACVRVFVRMCAVCMLSALLWHAHCFYICPSPKAMLTCFNFLEMPNYV